MIPLFSVAMNNPKAQRMVSDVLASGYVGQGEKVEQFEVAFGKLVGAPEPPLSLNSCTSALELALHLIGVGPGDDVISTPMTCTATNGAIVRSGATIVWADVDPITGNLNPHDVVDRFTKRTKAVVAVDWAGRVCDYAGIKAAALGIPVIQDAAHSLLAGKPGSGGDYVCWSFQAIKHLTTGDGGALLAPPSEMERARLLRWYGLNRRTSADFRCQQDIQEVGFKMHMNDIAAAIGLANLEIVESVVARHRAVAEWYRLALRGIPGVTLPPEDPLSAWWLYTLLVEDRDGFVQRLAEKGIAASPVHARNDKHKAFKAASETRGPMPGVDHFSAHEVAIPCGWWITDGDREHIAEAVWSAAKVPA